MGQFLFTLSTAMPRDHDCDQHTHSVDFAVEPAGAVTGDHTHLPRRREAVMRWNSPALYIWLNIFCKTTRVKEKKHRPSIPLTLLLMDSGDDLYALCLGSSFWHTAWGSFVTEEVYAVEISRRSLKKERAFPYRSQWRKNPKFHPKILQKFESVLPEDYFLIMHFIMQL